MSNRTLLLLALAICVMAGAVVVGRQSPATPVVETTQIAPRTVSKFWKGNLHTHTLWSDGDDFPEMVSDWYKRHGYDFLALTDHNVLSEGERWIDESAKTDKGMQKYLDRFGSHWVERREIAGKKQVRLMPLREFRNVVEEPGKFLLIPAEEISAAYAKLPVHVNAINLRDVVPPAKGDSVEQTIDVQLRAVNAQAKKTGWQMIAFLNHPNFGWGVRAEDIVLSENLKFFEVFNGHSSVRNYGDAKHASTERLWDIVLSLRLGKHNLPPIYGLGTDDAHNYHEMRIGIANPGRSWVMVRASHLTAENVLKGLNAGDFYASSGVVLDDIVRAENTLKLQIRGEPGVTYKTQFIATMRDASLDSKPVVDGDGKELIVTRQYGADVGKVVAEVEGLVPTYAFTRKELYIRAKVISSKSHPNPFAKGDVEFAWTQPVLP